MKSIIIVLTVLLSANLTAQVEEYIDEVKLKSCHCFVRGEIIKMELDNSVHLQLKSGQVLIIPFDKIQKIYQKRIGPGIRKPNRFLEKGIYNVTTASVSFNRSGGYSLTHTFGYRFDRLYSFGIGSGLENYEDGEGKRIIPIYAEVRGFLLDKKVTPYYSLRAGYGLGLKNDEYSIEAASGGLHLNPEIGFRLGGAETVNFFMGIGLKFQDASFEYRSPWEVSSTLEVIKYRRYMFSAGVVF